MSENALGGASTYPPFVSILGGCLGGLFSLAYGASFIVFYFLFRDDECEKELALWNLVCGCLFFASAILTGLFACLTCYCIANFFHTIFTLAALAWVIIGTIWISDMSYYHHYCQNDLYIFTLAMIIVQWAFVLISLVLSCCAHSRRRKAST